MEAGDFEEITYLESSIYKFSQYAFIFVDLTKGPRKKAHFAYVCQVDEVIMNRQ